MDKKEYFYLDGADKKGPFSKEEILELNLADDTLIYFSDLKNWTPFSEISDFKSHNKKKSNTEINKKKIKVSSFLILILMIVAFSGTAYYITDELRTRDWERFSNKIDEWFDGQNEICDYVQSPVEGRLAPPKDFFVYQLFDFEDPQKEKQYNELNEYFDCKTGGWTVYCLKEVGYRMYRYKFTETNSTDMGFKVPKTIYHPGTFNGYYTTPGYSTPTYRGTTQNAYNEALKTICIENENKSYVENSLGKISEFDDLFSKFYYIDVVETWKGLGNAYVHNKNWIVWHESKGKIFDVVFDKKAYYKKMKINIGIAVGLALFFFLIWRYGRRIELK